MNRTSILCLCLSCCFLLQGFSVLEVTAQSETMEYIAIIQEGQERFLQPIIGSFLASHPVFSSLLGRALEKHYTQHSAVEFASYINQSLTLKFIDGSYVVLLDVFASHPELSSQPIRTSHSVVSSEEPTALILNPSEYLYGNFFCRRIISHLIAKGYNIEYRANEAVNLSYIKQHLGAEIVYMNTHAGYWDIDGDHTADAVVIATGELWTNETEEIYSFEFENQMIVKGVVGSKSFVSFTPALITYSYNEETLPSSLIYMATCHATADASMATAFLQAGAEVYLGWNHDTVFWTNLLTSCLAFRLLVRGFSVQQICFLLRSGGFFNFLYHSKLHYIGNGNHRIVD